MSDGSVSQTWEALTEKADLLKVLFLKGTIESAVMEDLMDLLPYVWGFFLTKILSGGGARPFRILNTRYASVYCKIFPTQELMLSEDVTVMMAIGLSIKYFESLFVDRLNRF